MLIHMDGFDVYKTVSDLTFQYLTHSGTGLGTQAGRFGQGAVVFSGHGGDLGDPGIQLNFNVSYSDIWTGVAIYTADAGGLSGTVNFGTGDLGVFAFSSNLGWEGVITYNNFLGVWSFWTHTPSNSSSVPVYGGSGVFQTGTNVWHWVDIHYKPSNTTSGIVEIWVDDIRILNLTNIVTTTWGGSTINIVTLGAVNNNIGPTNAIATYDDWYILDAASGEYNTTRLGDSRIYSQIPISDVAGHNNGVPSSGTNYFAMVDEPQNDGLTTYITIQGTPGQEDIFNMSALPSEPPTIYANRVLNIVEQTAGGTITGNAIIVSGGVIAQGPTQPLLSVFFSQFGIFEEDPNTSFPWTWEAINAAQCGFIVANTAS